jgi:regulator of RNase E activity RraA
VSPDLRAAHVADALDAMGVRDRCISRLTQFLPGRIVVGAAFTLSCAPPGGEATERYAGLLAAIDAVKAGDVVVVASGPSTPPRCGASSCRPRALPAARSGS